MAPWFGLKLLPIRDKQRRDLGQTEKQYFPRPEVSGSSLTLRSHTNVSSPVCPRFFDFCGCRRRCSRYQHRRLDPRGLAKFLIHLSLSSAVAEVGLPAGTLAAGHLGVTVAET